MSNKYQDFFTEYLKANEGKLHFACHSHHYWPDVTRAAHLQYWDDSARLVDSKWDYLFSEKVPEAQQLISNVLGLSHPEQIAFAPNTHEFVARILSCFDYRKKIKVLTTDSEFYSFDRQIDRMSEVDTYEINKVPTKPFSNFEERFKSEINKDKYDLIFLSQVFFNSGYVVEDLETIVEEVSHSETIIVIDGYHGFMAVPTNLKSIEDRIFYVSGSYKYAQAGEGCCFMHMPKGCQLRPQNTGWFAQFGALSDEVDGKQRTAYADNGMRFAGATMDFSPLYRLISVLSLFKEQKMTVAETHSYVGELQKYFLDKVAALNHPHIHLGNLMTADCSDRGHFLTFELESAEVTSDIAAQLKEKGVLVDYRGNRLRFGFAIYQTEDWIDQLMLELTADMKE